MDQLPVLQQLLFFYVQDNRALEARLRALEVENITLHGVADDLQRQVQHLDARNDELDAQCDSLHAVLDRLIGYGTHEVRAEVTTAVRTVNHQQGFLDHIEALLESDSEDDLEFLFSAETIDLTSP